MNHLFEILFSDVAASLVASGALLRRVIKGDLDVAGKKIPNG